MAASDVGGALETASDHREIEWQLSARDLGSVRRWLSGHSLVEGLAIEPRPPTQLHDTYLDTDDWRLFRAGYALRARAEADGTEATLKALKSARDDLADRREISEALDSDPSGALLHSTGPVASRVQAVAGGHALRPLFEVRTLRHRFAVLSGGEGSEELGEIALDETVILRPEGEPAASLQRVEVEAHGGRDKPLEKLVKRLRAECALGEAPQSKYELGLRFTGLAPTRAPHLAPVEADGSMCTTDAALARLRRLCTAWFTYEPGARLGDDPEPLHDLRTTARRLDASLGHFAAYLPATFARSRQKVKSLLRTFGAVRDLDVQLEELAQFSGSLPEPDQRALGPLQRHLESERGKARSHMLKSLDSESTRDWLDHLVTGLAQSPSEPLPGGDVPAVAIAPELIEDRFRKLKKAYRGLTETSSTEEYHRVRGRVKKLRYAIESVASIYGKPAEQMLRRLRRLQDELGRKQDAHVAQQRLLGLASQPAQEFSPRALFLMGRFAEHCAAADVDARERIDKAWGKVRGRRWKALSSRLHALRDGAETVEAAAHGAAAAATAARPEARPEVRPETRPEAPPEARPEAPPEGGSSRSPEK